MWPPWGKARGGAAASASPRPVLNPSFSFSTFKDVGALLRDEDASPATAATPARKANVFHRVRIASAALRAWRSPSPLAAAAAAAGGVGEKRIVVYFTSLRVVRKTFEDCRAVRSILRGIRVAVDERDLSMDPSFRSDLKGLLGRKRSLALPQVFIGGRYVGGADEIRQLHETGELKRFVEGVSPAAPGSCEGCGGVRFVLCPSCSGSHKCFSDKGGGFRSCAACNENGLVRCPDCCPPAAAA